MPAISRVLVCGAGAVGSAYAARLYELDPSGVALLVDGARLERLGREGVTVNERRYDFQLRAAGDAGPRAELVLVAVKQHHLAAAIEGLRGAVGPGTIILSLLNGIVSEGMLAEAFGAQAVLHSYVVGTDFVREGTVTRYRSIGRIVFGAASGDAADARVVAVHELLERAGIPHEVSGDIVRELWWKFMLNVGVNQVSAVLRAPYGAFGLPEVGGLARDAMREVVRLSALEGVALTEADVERCFPIFASLDPAGKTSMLQDVEAGRKTEVESFAGTVVELGRRHGVPTPVNEVLGRLIVGLERLGGAGPT